MTLSLVSLDPPSAEVIFLAVAVPLALVYLGRKCVRRLLAWVGAVWFSEYQWGRKLAGGKWERWFVASCGEYLWLPVKEFFRVSRKTPEGCLLRRSESPQWEDYSS